MGQYNVGKMELEKNEYGFFNVIRKVLLKLYGQKRGYVKCNFHELKPNACDHRTSIRICEVGVLAKEGGLRDISAV